MNRVEPLFAHNRRLWLRLWAAMQGVALVVALAVSGLNARSLTVAALLVVYHIVGLLAHDRLLRRLWAVLLFVTIGWVLVFAAMNRNAAFALLLFGQIVQAFVFLPFAWGVVGLACATVGFMSIALARLRQEGTGAVVTQVGAVVAIGVMFGTVLLYIHTANRLQAAQREAGAMEERERLSRDIHDTVAQGFASVLRHLELVTLELRQNGTTADASVVQHLADAASVSRDSLAEIRRLVRALRPAELTEAPLSGAIERIVKRWGDEYRVVADVSLTPVPALKPDADVIFLRAVQESLSNVARHANARHVRVTLGRVDELVLLTVEDDGRGFAESEVRSGEHFGLSGIRERVRPFSGHVLIDSKPGAGASVTVAMPLATIQMPQA